MSDSAVRTSDFRRVAGMAGVISAIALLLGLVAGFAQGAPPALDASSQEITTFFSDNEGLARMAGLLNVLPILTLPIFFAGIYVLFRDSGAAAGPRGVLGDGWPVAALIAFIALGVFSTIQGAAAFAITLGVQDEFGGQPAVGGALFDLYNAIAPASALSMALLLWSIAMCNLRAGTGQPWLKTLLYVGAAAAALSFFAPFLEIDALAYFGLLAFLIFIAWVGVAAMDLMRATGLRT